MKVNKRTILVVLIGVITVSTLAEYQLFWSYETFEIKDASNPASFVNRKRFRGNYTHLTICVNGELEQGSRVVKVYECHDTQPGKPLLLREPLISKVNIKSGVVA